MPLFVSVKNCRTDTILLIWIIFACHLFLNLCQWGTWFEFEWHRKYDNYPEKYRFDSKIDNFQNISASRFLLTVSLRGSLSNSSSSQIESHMCFKFRWNSLKCSTDFMEQIFMHLFCIKYVSFFFRTKRVRSKIVILR